MNKKNVEEDRSAFYHLADKVFRDIFEKVGILNSFMEKMLSDARSDCFRQIFKHFFLL